MCEYSIRDDGTGELTVPRVIEYDPQKDRPCTVSLTVREWEAVCGHLDFVVERCNRSLIGRNENDAEIIAMILKDLRNDAEFLRTRIMEQMEDENGKVD